jgi:exopolysaccharide production protein ExoQ
MGRVGAAVSTLSADPGVLAATASRPSRHGVLDIAHLGLILLLLFAFAGAHQSALFGLEAPEALQNSTWELEVGHLRTAWLVIHVVVLALLVRHGLEIVGAALRLRWLTFLVLLCAASALWSVSLDNTLRRSLALIGTTGFGIYLGWRFDTLTRIRLVAGAVGLGLVVSVAAWAIDPASAFMRDMTAEALKGTFGHKNHLGIAAAVEIVALLLLLGRTRRFSLLLPGGIALAALLLVLSRSATAWVYVVGLPLVVLAVSAARSPADRAPHRLLLAGGVGLAALLAGLVLFDPLVAAFGREGTLTGRTLLWHEVVDLIAARPLLGYGFGAVFAPIPEPLSHILPKLRWVPAHAHNGYLDIALALGTVGVVAFTLMVAALWRPLLRCIRDGGTVEVYWSAAIVTLGLLTNLSESYLPRQNNLVWVLFVSTAVDLIGRAAAPVRRRWT